MDKSLTMLEMAREKLKDQIESKTVVDVVRATLPDLPFPPATFDAVMYNYVSFTHYENMPMQYTEIFLALKIENFQLKKMIFFLIFAQNIDCGYTLEPPRRGGSNEYPQSMFWSKNKKNMYTPAYPSFAI